jgi:hypothetical protein
MKKKVELTTIHDGDFTISFGVYSTGKVYFPFAGATKRNQEDRMNLQRGETLSVGRAFKNLGRNILRREFEIIHQHQQPVSTVYAVLPEVKAKKKCTPEITKEEKKPKPIKKK